MDIRHRNLQPTTYNLKPKKGFTIVELIVVVAIIGIVSGIIVASVNNSKAKGRDSKRIADISVIQLALENYYDINRNYPTSLSVFSSDSSVPIKDPLGGDYLYAALDVKNENVCSSGGCQSYHLGATLELASGILDDDTVDKDGTVGFEGGDNSGCGGGSGKCYDVLPKF